MSAPKVQINMPSSGLLADKPEVKGEIEGLWVSTRENEKTAIILVVSVSNVGSPSIIEGWSLKGTGLKERNAAVNPVDFQDGLKFGFGGALPIARTDGCLHSRDNLVHKTLTTPLQSGGKQRGILLFLADLDATFIGLPMGFF
jgi:hypothetical protein